MNSHYEPPLNISYRVGTSSGKDLVVENVLDGHRIVVFRNIKTGDSELASFEDVRDQMLLGHMRVTARRQIAKPLSCNTRCDFVQSRLQFCLGLDEADARFMISSAVCTPIIERVAKRFNVPVPSYTEVMHWWRMWAFADRNASVLEVSNWEAHYVA